jgi:N-hydroxyarylamine O-acetyltransferase
MEIMEYLERIEIHNQLEPHYAFLAELQQSHMLHVPFENLDVIHKRKIVLKPELLFDKIVRNKRGGFCYELNALFAWLLRKLGYQVRLLSARVFDGERDDFGPEFDHMTLLVETGGSYLVDVGFGDSFRTPLPMPRGRVEDISGSYRVYSNPGSHGQVYELHHHNEHGWHPQYRFSTIPRQLAEFEEMCNYHQTSPESSFTQRTVCTRATLYGRVTLTENNLTITEGKEKRMQPVSSAENFNQFLQEYFDIQDV